MTFTDEQAAMLTRAREAVGAARETRACIEERRITREHVRKVNGSSRTAKGALLATARVDP